MSANIPMTKRSNPGVGDRAGKRGEELTKTTTHASLSQIPAVNTGDECAWMRISERRYVHPTAVISGPSLFSGRRPHA